MDAYVFFFFLLALITHVNHVFLFLHFTLGSTFF
jgi:hypothetical protein